MKNELNIAQSRSGVHPPIFIASRLDHELIMIQGDHYITMDPEQAMDLYKFVNRKIIK